MALQPGSHIGLYEILSALGEGTMGEVYRARDTKLNREVALKILPVEFANDPERLARFKREARVLASLNHPNIAAIYGFEDSGSTHALVLELVEGPTLADRIAKGPIPLDDALPIAKQIAEALEAAHEQGIIHRDLKPANIKVRADGMAKVLDFGLAKALTPEVSPTVTTPAMMTDIGVILGTPAYMSPEQTKGHDADKRSDIWAFGCVLYEILTGRAAFTGKSISEVFAAILRGEPDWHALSATTPLSVRDLLRRCLQKDRTLRLRDAGDARIEILEALTLHSSEPAVISRTAGWPIPTLLITSAVIGALLSGAGVWYLKAAKSIQPPAHLVVALPLGDRVQNTVAVTLSPDGSQLAYVAIREGTARLFVRAMDSAEARGIPGTEGAFNPFFSADGRSVGFFAQGKMKKVSLSGGAPTVICDSGISGGASWGSDDTIVFSPTATSGLWRVPAAGGTPQPLTAPNTSAGEISHRYPQILPGGQAIIFTSLSGVAFDESQVEILRLDTKKQRVLVRGGHTGRFLRPGYLMYYRAGTLLAIPFDLARLEVPSAAPVTVADGVLQTGGASGAAYAVSSDGRTLVYVPSGASGPHQLEKRLIWIDRHGRSEPLAAPLKNYQPASLALSPDDQRVAVAVRAGTDDIWIYDVTGGTFVPFTSGPESRRNPVWSPDGTRVVYRGRGGLYWRLADGSGPEQPLTTARNAQQPFSWYGDVIAYMEFASSRQIWILPLEGNQRARRFLPDTPSNEVSPMFSPNGRWLAYESDRSGSSEVYVRPYPGPGEEYKVSKGGGTTPQWNPSGGELFYRNGDQTMVVNVTTTGFFHASNLRVLYEGTAGVPARDGQRFLAIQATEPEQPPTQLHVLLNWSEEMKQHMPVK